MADDPSGDGKAEGHLLQTVAKGLGLHSVTVLSKRGSDSVWSFT